MLKIVKDILVTGVSKFLRFKKKIYVIAAGGFSKIRKERLAAYSGKFLRAIRNIPAAVAGRILGIIKYIYRISQSALLKIRKEKLAAYAAKFLRITGNIFTAVAGRILGIIIYIYRISRSALLKIRKEKLAAYAGKFLRITGNIFTTVAGRILRIIIYIYRISRSALPKIRKEKLAFASGLLIVTLIIFLLIRLGPEPPVNEVKNAREALSEARKNRADAYSRSLFAQADNYYDSAMTIWKKENDRFYYFRDYDKVIKYAGLSAAKAEEASENSVTSTANLNIKLKKKISSLTELVSANNELFVKYPLSSDLRNNISRGKLLLTEAEISYSRGQYLEANRKITDAEYLLTSSYDRVSENLKNYFKSYSHWKNLVNKTISESKNDHDYSIIIDKFSRKCYIYFSGIKKYEFDVELGKNWVGNKRVKGDKATPEGMYKITEKLEGPKAGYYKALMLNYPNEEDKTRFRTEVARGALPASANPGGYIEIHGNGGKGVDWTSGCVALTDREMDLVYNIAKVGTPVTIVGSMADLNTILDK
jgi:hypothetical protein